MANWILYLNTFNTRWWWWWWMILWVIRENSLTRTQQLTDCEWDEQRIFLNWLRFNGWQRHSHTTVWWNKMKYYLLAVKMDLESLAICCFYVYDQNDQQWKRISWLFGEDLDRIIECYVYCVWRVQRVKVTAADNDSVSSNDVRL